MKKLLLFSFIIVLVVTCLFKFHSYVRHNIQHSLIHGFWRGFDTFCHNADLSMMLLYVGEYNSRDDLYSCYIVAVNEHGFILNDSFNMRLTPSNSYKLTNINTILYKAIFEGINHQHFPSTQYVEFDPHGTMRFFVGDSLYANLYRDCSLNQHEYSEKIKEYSEKKIKGQSCELPGSNEEHLTNDVDKEEDVDTIEDG